MTKAKPHPLRALQYRTHLAIDRRFDPLAVDAERIVLRHARTMPDGTARITPFGRLLILAELDALLRRAEPGIAREIAAAAREAERMGAGDGQDR